MLGSYCPNVQFELRADVIKTLNILLLNHHQEFYGNLSCGVFLPNEFYAELAYVFYGDNFIFKNSKYFWYS